MTDTLRVGIIGAGGYTGSELLRLCHGHPRLSIEYVAARDNAGQAMGMVLTGLLGVPELANRVLEAFEPQQAGELAQRIDVAFTALPHAASATVSAALWRQGIQVIDLSADFRLRDRQAYEHSYGPHPHPELLESAVYGLVELHRRELRGAMLIASPGCYPTSGILPLAPLLANQLVETEGIIIDAKSGVSGAGRKPLASTHFSECSEGIRPYKVAGTHRHTPEIEQELGLIARAPIRVVFTPNLCPMTRGILAVAYARAKPSTTLGRCVEAARQMFDSSLVQVLEEALPDTLWVRGSACAHVAYRIDERTQTVLAMCAIDNLAKGASAQALQALNAARGWDDALGLPCIAVFP